MNEHAQAAATAPLFDPLSPEFIRDPYPITSCCAVPIPCTSRRTPCISSAAMPM